MRGKVNVKIEKKEGRSGRVMTDTRDMNIGAARWPTPVTTGLLGQNTSLA